ncbi:uncharacterized protein [Halyomorpha halys]|uniref:uncharacterized protein n=1 Tax=Halyomorpha halys TaxID=286706 RepID=UPI0006D4EBC2|nr:uncharacterized protein LOC106688770 [Halyomorpha halys]
MNIPPPQQVPCKEIKNREEWDKCIRHGTWRVAIGIILGAIGSAVVVSEMPMVIGTGLGIGWAVRHCKNLMRKTDTAKQKKPEDPCACCNSTFEALDAEEFADVNTQVPKHPPSPPQHPPKDTYEEEEKCTCHEIPVTWSPPKPVDDDYFEPTGCSCYR